MDWDNQADNNPSAVCPNFAVPWDTTFQLGILNGGLNALYFSGNNYGLSGLNNPTLIQVAASDCNSGSSDIAVTNTNDEGPGSLRQAIVCANAQPGYNRIVFNLIGNGPDTIRVGEELHILLLGIMVILALKSFSMDNFMHGMLPSMPFLSEQTIVGYLDLK